MLSLPLSIPLALCFTSMIGERFDKLKPPSNSQDFLFQSLRLELHPYRDGRGQKTRSQRDRHV